MLHLALHVDGMAGTEVSFTAIAKSNLFIAGISWYINITTTLRIQWNPANQRGNVHDYHYDKITQVKNFSWPREVVKKIYRFNYFEKGKKEKGKKEKRKKKEKTLISLVSI